MDLPTRICFSCAMMTGMPAIRSSLRTAGVPAQAVEAQLAIPLSGEAVVTNILEAARANQCGTVVVGRQSFSWLQELFQHHIGGELFCRGQGLAIWVVE